MKMRKKHFLFLFITIGLTACANPPSSNISTLPSQDLRSDYMELLAADEELQINLLDNKSRSPQQIINEEKQLQPLAENKCLTPYKQELLNALNLDEIKKQTTEEDKILVYRESLKRTYKKSIDLDSSLPICLKDLGLSGKIRVNYRGQYYNVPQYFQMIMVKTNQLISTAAQNRQKTRTTEDQLNEIMLQEQISTQNRLLATIQAKRRLANAQPGSPEWIEMQLFGNPYIRGQQDLAEDLRQLNMAQEALRKTRENNARLEAMKYNQKNKCFNVNPYYRKDGTYVQGHIRCK